MILLAKLEFASATTSSGSAYYENSFGVGFILENIGDTEETVDISFDWSLFASADLSGGSPFLFTAAGVFAAVYENPTIVDQGFDVNGLRTDFLEEGVGLSKPSGQFANFVDTIVPPGEISATNISSFLFTVPAGETAGVTLGTAAVSGVSTVPVPASLPLILGSLGCLAAIRLKKYSRRYS